MKKVLLDWSQGHDWNSGNARLATREEAIECLKSKLNFSDCVSEDQLDSLLASIPADCEKLDITQNNEECYSWYLGWGSNPGEDLCAAREDNDLIIMADGQEVYRISGEEN